MNTTYCNRKNITCSISGISYMGANEFTSTLMRTHNFHPIFSIPASSVLSEVRAKKGNLSISEVVLLMTSALKEVGMITTASYREGSFPFQELLSQFADKSNVRRSNKAEVMTYRLKGAIKVATSVITSYNKCNDRVRKELAKELPVVILSALDVSSIIRLLKDAAMTIETANFSLSNNAYHQTNFLESYKKKSVSPEVAGELADELAKSNKLTLSDFVNTYLDIADTFPEVFTSLGHNLEDQIDFVKAAYSSNISYIKSNLEQLNEMVTTLVSITDKAGINSVAHRTLINMIESCTKAAVTQLRHEHSKTFTSVDVVSYKGKGGVEVTMVSTSELDVEDLLVEQVAISKEEKAQAAKLEEVTKKEEEVKKTETLSKFDLLRKQLAARTANK